MQCPASTPLHPNGSAVDPAHPGVVRCQHIGGGDGYATMGDGHQIYLARHVALRPPDLAALPAAPPPAAAILASGLLGKLEEAPLPPAWHGPARLTYPFDLPEQRQVRMGFPRTWFNVRHLAVVDEQVQTDTWLACTILSETVGHMLDSFVRDYLVERLESLVGHRLANGYYPRLGLAPGQRFASEGGYLVRFAGPAGPRVLPDGDWLAP